MRATVAAIALCALLPTLGCSPRGGTGAVPELGEDTVRVLLSWEEEADIELEVTDPAEAGEPVLTAVADGSDPPGITESPQYFDFRGDHAQGTYLVSAYFRTRRGGDVDEVAVTFEVIAADGATASREATLGYEPGRDVFRAFRIDAETGEIEDVREYAEAPY